MRYNIIPLNVLILALFLGPRGNASTHPYDSRYSNKNFTVISGPAGALSISKNPIASDVVMVSGNRTLSFKGSGKDSKFTFTETSFDQLFEVSLFSRAALVVISRPLISMFNESACPTPNLDPITRLLNSDFTSAINEITDSSKLFSASCDSIRGPRRKKMSDIVSAGINPKTSYFTKCFSSEKISKLSKLNPDFLELANKVTAKHIDDFERIREGKDSLKVECVEGKVASYDPKTQALKLPIENDTLVADACKSSEQVFAHEFFHRAGLNEKETAYLDSICGNLLRVDASNSSSCKEVYKAKLRTEGIEVAKAADDAQNELNKVQQKEITAALSKKISSKDLIPVTNKDLEEITNPTSPAAYEASVERVYVAMSTNMEKVAAPLNRAIASTVSTASASTSSSSSSSSSRNVASTSAPTVKRAEIKANDYEKIAGTTKIQNIRNAQGKSNSNGEYIAEEILVDNNRSARNANSRNVASTGSATANPTGGTNAPSAELAGSGATAGGTPAFVTRTLPGGGSSGSGGSAGSIAAGGSGSGSSTTGPSSRTASARPNARGPANFSGNDALIEQLGNFNEVRGQRYKAIQERYTDPTLATELRARNIAIEYKRNNQVVTIGDMNANSRTVFRDDGTSLKKVTGAR